MAHLRFRNDSKKDGKGCYYMRFFDGENWNERSLRTQDRKEAERLRDELAPRLEKPRSFTLDHLIARVLEHKKDNMSRPTHDMYALALRLLREVTGGKILVRDLTLDDIEAFKKRRRENGVLVYTLHRDMRHIRSAFRLAVRHRWIDQNPLEGMEFPSLPRINRVIIDHAGMRSLVEAAESIFDFQVAVSLAYECGMRLSEVTHVEWEDIDFERSTLNIRDKEGYRVKARSQRLVSISSDTLDLLNRLPRRGSRVFYNTKGQPLSSYCLAQMFKRFARKAGLKDVSFKSLRHSSATMMARGGISGYVISRMLGHSNPSTTEIYLHNNVDALRRANEVTSVSRVLAEYYHPTATGSVSFYPASGSTIATFYNESNMESTRHPASGSIGYFDDGGLYGSVDEW